MTDEKLSKTSKLTETQLSVLSVKELTELYNEMVPTSEAIKKFDTKTSGVARVIKKAKQLYEAMLAKRETLIAEEVAKQPAPAPFKIEDAPAKLQKHLRSKATAKATASSAPTNSVSSVMRELILAGKSNTEIFALCQQRFGLDDSKKGYPAWYRRELKLKGEISA